MTLYGANGQINTTSVAGSSYTGLYAADGSYNIVINTSSSYVGLHHACGALNAFVVTDPSASYYAPNGSMNVIANASSPSGYSPVQPIGSSTGSPVVPNTMSLDGTNSNVDNPVSILSTDITTTKTNNIVVAAILTNGGPLTSVVGTTLGAFTKRATAGPLPTNVELWYAVSPGLLTNEFVTANATGSGYMSMIVFAVNGANTSAPWDTNVSLPNTGTTDPRTVSTTGTNTMVVGVLRGSTDMPTAGAGYTAIENDLIGAFMLVEYKLASSPQTNLSVTVGTGAGTTNAAIGDALVQGP